MKMKILQMKMMMKTNGMTNTVVLYVKPNFYIFASCLLDIDVIFLLCIKIRIKINKLRQTISKCTAFYIIHCFQWRNEQGQHKELRHNGQCEMLVFMSANTAQVTIMKTTVCTSSKSYFITQCTNKIMFLCLFFNTSVQKIPGFPRKSTTNKSAKLEEHCLLYICKTHIL